MEREVQAHQLNRPSPTNRRKGRASLFSYWTRVGYPKGLLRKRWCPVPASSWTCRRAVGRVFRLPPMWCSQLKMMWQQHLMVCCSIYRVAMERKKLRST